MYCIKCGVKLSDTEKKCPLCGTTVCHPDFLNREDKSSYPKNKKPKAHSGLKALGGVIIILFLLPLVISFFSDLQPNGKLDWFGFVAGGLIVMYVAFALPLWFKKPNPVIFVPCSFLALAVYLFYINFATSGNWFLTFALPVVGFLSLLVTAIVTLLRYLKRGRLYISGGSFILFGGFLLLLEYLLTLTFGIGFIGWSTYPLIVFVLLGGLLIYLAINSAAREMLERKFFF